MRRFFVQVVLFGVVALASSSSDPALLRAAERLLNYCNADPVAPAHDEGIPPMPGAELVQVSMLMRHGDRSAIHTLPGTTRYRWPCTAPSTYETQWAATVLQPWRSNEDCIAASDDEADPACESLHRHQPPQQGLSGRVEHAIAAWRKARDEGEGCGAQGGELSSIGWQQLTSLGEAAAARYSSLMTKASQPQESKLKLTQALRVISTDTGRTLLSATAFVRGLLNGLGVHSGLNPLQQEQLQHQAGDGSDAADTTYYSRQAARHYSSRHADAMILGIGRGTTVDVDGDGEGETLLRRLGIKLPLRLHVVPRPEDLMMAHARLPLCPLAMHYERVYSDDVTRHLHPPHGIQDRLRKAMADIDIEGDSHVPGTEGIADDLYTRLCHGEPLPCWGQGKRNEEAMTTTTVEEREECSTDGLALPESSWLLSARNGTTVSSTADLHRDRRSGAFLHSHSRRRGNCLSACDAAAVMALGDAYYKSRYSSPSIRLMLYPFLKQISRHLRSAASATTAAAGDAPRMVIRTAHDVVLSPLLSTLGYDWASSGHQAWSGYASRINLELWRAPSRSSPSSSSDIDISDSEFLLRILYNGRDITNQTACWKKPKQSAVCEGGTCSASSDIDIDSWPCTLPAFEALVKSLIHPAESWEDACAGRSIPAYFPSLSPAAGEQVEAGDVAAEPGPRSLDEDELAELFALAAEFKRKAGQDLREAVAHPSA